MSFFKKLFGAFNNTPKEENKTNSVPSQDLLEDILWNFAGATYKDVEAFAKALKAYNDDVNPENELNVDRIFNSATEIIVQYTYWGEDEDGDEDELEADIVVKTDCEAGFSVKEFLFKVHNQICAQMMEIDATFFEGITPVSDHTETPHFYLNQGS